MFKEFRYRDKNNNTYRIDGQLLHYTGIKPNQSSSGTYDGGRDQLINISKADINKLKTIVAKTTNTSSSKRTMGSSSLHVNGSSYLLAYNSNTQKEIESILSQIITSPHKQLSHNEYKSSSHEHDIHLLLDGLTDRANIATAFRLAEAMGIKKLIILDSGYTEPNGQIIKKSRHTTKYIDHEFSLSTNYEIEPYIAKNWLILGLEITDKSVDLSAFSPSPNRPILLIVGSEQHGISEKLLNTTNACLHIPMYGKNSSMNVMQAAGICIFNLIQKMKV
jgi:tRNA G18 (ribose-2'-O)-methylase SpoU